MVQARPRSYEKARCCLSVRLNEHSGHKTSRAQHAAVPRNDAAWTNRELEVEVKLPTRADERSCHDIK